MSSSSSLAYTADDAVEMVFRSWSPAHLEDLVAAAAAPEVEPEPEEIDPAVLEAQIREEERRREVQEWERRIAEARQQGFAEGRAEGEMAEGARLRHAVRAAEDALEELRMGEMRWTGTIEENVCALAVIIARQIIGRELATDAEPVLQLVRNALAEFPIDQPMRIRVNPGDLAAISRTGADGRDPLLAVTRDRDARWLPDAAISPGGCVVEGRERIIDGRVDGALERIYRRLTYTHA